MGSDTVLLCITEIEQTVNNHTQEVFTALYSILLYTSTVISNNAQLR